MPENIDQLTTVIKSGGVAVIPTDTLYGIVASVESKTAVDKVYSAKKRSPDKSVIILIADISQLELFGITITGEQKEMLENIWPGPVSIELPCPSSDWSYLHHGTKTLAFRLPDSPWLKGLVTTTGPIIAPSANFEGEKPAENIEEARAYFGDLVDYYYDGGTVSDGQPSTLVSLTGNKFIIKRQGQYKLDPKITMITYDDFKKLELVVATIKEASRVEGSDKLLQLLVDIGTEERQIIAGVGKNHDPETLIGQQIIIIKNLEPRKLMGLESQGMLLAASGEEGPILLTPEKPADPGSGIN